MHGSVFSATGNKLSTSSATISSLHSFSETSANFRLPVRKIIPVVADPSRHCYNSVSRTVRRDRTSVNR